MLTHIFMTGMERTKYEPVGAKLWYIHTMYYNVLYGGGGKKISTFIQSINICVSTLFHKQGIDMMYGKTSLLS